MSDATSKEPSQAELDANAIPAILRRAPRFARVIGTGAVAGFVLGFVIALGLPGRGASYRILSALLIGLGLALVGALAAGAIATRSDGVDARSAHARGVKPETASLEAFLGTISDDAKATSPAATTPAAKKTTSKASAAKKSPAKTTAATKPAAKKPAAKKPAAKKPAAKKPAPTSSKATSSPDKDG